MLRLFLNLKKKTRIKNNNLLTPHLITETGIKKKQQKNNSTHCFESLLS